MVGNNGSADRRRLPALPIEKPPPQDLRAEQALIGSVLLSMGERLPDVRAIISGPQEFAGPGYTLIWDTVCRMADNGQVLDLVTVRDALASAGMENAETPLREAIEEVGSEANAVHYARVVHEKYVWRERMAAHHAAAQAAASCNAESHTKAVKTLDALGGCQGELSTWSTAAELIASAEFKAGMKPVSSGYFGLDGVLRGGFRPGCLYVLAARTGDAKSMLACNIARRVALNGVCVLFFKLEERPIEAVWRMTAAAARAPFDLLLDGNAFTSAHAHRFEEGAGIMNALPIRMSGVRSIDAIERQAQMHRDRGGGFIIIDQASHIRVPDRAVGYEQTTEASARLQELADRVSLPIVLVSQVTRNAAQKTDDDEHLSIHDLRNTGTLENDAAGVILIDKVRKPEGPEYGAVSDLLYLHILVGKNRYGCRTKPDEPIRLAFFPAECRIENVREPTFDYGGEP